MKKRSKKQHKKYTQNQLEYKKELSRIKRFIKRAEKRGYTFNFDIPDLPKRVTKKSIEKLKRETTPEKLYEKSFYGGFASYGEKVAGKEGLKLERSARSQKAAKTRALNKEAERKFWGYEDAKKHFSELPIGGETAFRNALEQFISRLSTRVGDYDPYTGRKRSKRAVEESENQRVTLLSLVTEEVNAVGERVVGERIMKNPGVTYYLDYVLYGSDAALIQTSALMVAKVIKGFLTEKEKEDLADESESEEDWENPE